MARPKKDGSKPINREVAQAKAHSHREFSWELEKVITASVATRPPDLSVGSGADLALSLGSYFAQRYEDLLGALQELSEEHETLSSKWNNVVASVTVGMPKRGAPSFDSPTGMLASIPKISALAKPPGRHTKQGPKFDQAVYLSVEEARLTLQEARQPSTIAAGLNAVLRASASATKQDAEEVIERKYASFLAAYKRGREKRSSQ